MWNSHVKNQKMPPRMSAKINASQNVIYGFYDNCDFQLHSNGANQYTFFCKAHPTHTHTHDRNVWVASNYNWIGFTIPNYLFYRVGHSDQMKWIREERNKQKEIPKNNSLLEI